MIDGLKDIDKIFVKIKIDMGQSFFNYRGILIEETDDFITIDEIKEGKLKLNKSKCVSIRYCKEGEE